MAIAPKKFDPRQPVPNRNLLIAGFVLILAGLLWSVYEFNPFDALRPVRPEEKKERDDAKNEEKMEALRKKRR